MKLLTDDQDLRDTELDVYIGGNGDYYIELTETRKGDIVRIATRISTSGGNRSTEVLLAVANLYRALNKIKVEQPEEKKEVEDRRLCMVPGSCINEDGECKDCRYFK